MFKRVMLFIATNLAVLLVLSIVLRLLGVDRILDESGTGINYEALLVLSLVIGFGGSFISLAMSKWLAKRSTGHTIYILDEPTTGLHFEDIRKLLTVLTRLVDQGNTVVVIEHNLDVIKTADWIIDLGPEGGSGGGQIVVAGTPEDVARHTASHTGRFLAPMLARD